MAREKRELGVRKLHSSSREICVRYDVYIYIYLFITLLFMTGDVGQKVFEIVSFNFKKLTHAYECDYTCLDNCPC